MRYWSLVRSFARASAQEELAYRANFWISLVHSFLNLGTGVLGVLVLFSRVEQVGGWDLPATLSLLGVYLTLAALRGLFIGPSLDVLAGMDGEVWTGRFDYTLLRPVDVQIQASIRHWRPLALIDLLFGVGVLVVAIMAMGQGLPPMRIAFFVVGLISAVVILYSILLGFTGMVFWSPGFLFTWLFDALYQMARYPISMYPGWLQLVLTWVIPVGVMTTIPAQALSGAGSPGMLVGGIFLAAIAFTAATVIFRSGLRRYASASS